MVFAHHYHGRVNQPPPQKGRITKIIIANKRGRGGGRAKERPLEVKVNIIVTHPKLSSPHPLPTPFSGDK